MVQQIGRLFSILLLAFLATAWPSDTEECFLTDQDSRRLQMVFVIDRSTSLNVDVRNILYALPKIASKLADEYPGSEFGEALFSDYPLDDDGRPGRNYVTGCYHHLQNLTTKLPTEKLITLREGDGSGPKNTMGAVAFAATDKRMGWALEDRAVRKFIVLATGAAYSKFLNPSVELKRKPFQGDGTETCQKTRKPTISDVGRVLRESSISFIALLQNEEFIKPSGKEKKFNAISEYYQSYCEEMEIDCDLFKTSGKNSRNPEVEYEKHIRKAILKMPRCEWADPPAYNTMGL